MSEVTLLLLRIGFLLLLWFFIFAIVYALRSDLFGAPVRRLPGNNAKNGAAPAGTVPNTPRAAPAPAPSAGGPPVTPSAGALPTAAPQGPARYLVITSGKADGTSIPLDDDIITIGRSADSTLVIVDEYTSTYHARLARNGDQWMLTDLDSTNGTKIDGARVGNPVPVPLYTPVSIGTTTFELRP